MVGVFLGFVTQGSDAGNESGVLAIDAVRELYLAIPGFGETKEKCENEA